MNSACKQDLFISSPTSTVFSLAWLQPLLHICRKKKHTAVGEPRVAKVPRKKNAAKNQQVTAVQQCSLLAPHSNFSFTSTMAYSARHCYSGQRQQQRHSHSVFPFCQKHNLFVWLPEQKASSSSQFTENAAEKFRALVPVRWKNIPHSAAQVLAFYRHPFATHNSSCAVYRKFGKWWSTGYFQANTMQSLLSSVVRIYYPWSSSYVIQESRRRLLVALILPL